jgi:hypothetical protein
MKVIICGGRTFRDENLLKEKCDFYLKNSNVTEIVTGGQVTIRKKDNYKYGADYFGKQYAVERNIPYKEFPADWDNLGKSAGPIRNDYMGSYITPDGVVIAFWDGWSKGTANMIAVANKLGLPLRVVRFDNKLQSLINPLLTK